MKVKKLPAICAAAKDICITQRVLNNSAKPYAGVGYVAALTSVSVIDGKHVAVIAVSNDAMRAVGEPASPHLQCSCDFYYTIQKQSRCHMDTFFCERKKALRTARRSELREEYHAKGTSAENIFLDLFARVTRGDWVGQGQGDRLYLQEAAEVAGIDVGHALAGWDIGQKLVAEKKIALNGAIMVPYVDPATDIPNAKRIPLEGGCEECDNPDFVWATALDKRFYCEVQRLKSDTHKGVLCIFDKDEQNKLIGFAEVGLSYGAQFGPDGDDVANWQENLEWFVDQNIYKPAILPSPPNDELKFTLISA